MALRGGTPARLHADFLSQPSRACAIFSKVNKLPVEIAPVKILKYENSSPEFLAKAPLGKVPVLQVEDFFLQESAAILTYLACAYDVPEHWYPRKDLKAQAFIQAALHWHHSSLRSGCFGLLNNKVYVKVRNQFPNEEREKEGQDLVNASLRLIDDAWLDDKLFVGGSKISIADLQFACELEQLTLLKKAIHGIDKEELLKPYPDVHSWLSRVSEECEPFYSEVHETIREWGKAMGAKP